MALFEAISIRFLQLFRVFRKCCVYLFFAVVRNTLAFLLFGFFLRPFTSFPYSKQSLGIQTPSEKVLKPLKTPQSTSSGGVWMPREYKERSVVEGPPGFLRGKITNLAVKLEVCIRACGNVQH